MAEFIEVYSDRYHDGWRAEVNIVVGPIKRRIHMTEKHPTPSDAEQAAANWFLTGFLSFLDYATEASEVGGIVAEPEQDDTADADEHALSA